MEEPDWGRAACLNEPGDIWFPDFWDSNGEEIIDDGNVKSKVSGYDDAYELGRIICGGCPLREECLEWALHQRERYGMWGGSTPSDRKRILRNQRRHSVT